MISETSTILDLAQVRSFANEHIRKFATQFDLNGSLPSGLIQSMADEGYLGATIPLEYGGLGIDPVSNGLLTEEIGKACSSVRSLLTVHLSLVADSIIKFGTEAQKVRFLPSMATGKMIAAFALSEPETGSDAKSVKTTYRKTEGDYKISGHKKWITMGSVANLFLVIASNEGSVTAFLVPASAKGIRVVPIKGLMANRAAHVSEIFFDDVSVPRENVLGNEGSGFSFIVNSALDSGRYSVAWGGLGIAQEAIDCMVAYARSRKQFGKRLHTFQLVQEVIANGVVSVTAARALCMQAGKLRSEQHPDATIQTTIAKYYTSRIANQVTSDAVQIHGGNGISNEYPAERLFREAKVLEIIEGTTQVLQEVIANHGLTTFYKPQ